MLSLFLEMGFQSSFLYNRPLTLSVTLSLFTKVCVCVCVICQKECFCENDHFWELAVFLVVVTNAFSDGILCMSLIHNSGCYELSVALS